jgi:hypothetical protein
MGWYTRNLKEIEEYRVELGIPKNKTYIMPAGDTREHINRNVSISI